jgi:hypothetical protein
MMTSVPQFIDVEDKVAGPLTWKQLGWMIAMGALLFVFYTMFRGILFYLIAVPVVMLFVALAFFRPNGMAFPQFLFYSVTFLFRPKVSVWERPVHRASVQKVAPVQEHQEQQAPVMTTKDFSELAKKVDRR